MNIADRSLTLIFAKKCYEDYVDASGASVRVACASESLSVGSAAGAGGGMDGRSGRWKGAARNRSSEMSGS